MSPDDQTTLIQLDITVDTAMSDGTLDQLDPLLAEDFIYTHSTGLSQPREVFLQAQAAREDRSGRTLSAMVVEPHADVAVTHGTLTITYRSNRPPHAMRYVRTWRRGTGRWQLVSHLTLENLTEP